MTTNPRSDELAAGRAETQPICGAPIRPRLGPFRFRLKCTLKPNHEALGIAEHRWEWISPLVELSAKDHR
jgi:hypothetical protein